MGVTHVVMNDGKVYVPISYDDQVSEYEKFVDKPYPSSLGTKNYTSIKKEQEKYFDEENQLYSTAISQIK